MSAAPQSGAYTAESNVYNSQGQLTQETQYNSVGTAVYIRSSIAYDYDGKVTFDYLEQVISGTDHQYQDEYFYTASPTSNPTGVYEGGQLTNVSTDQRTGGHAFVYGTAYTYIWTTQALQSVIGYNNGSGSSTPARVVNAVGRGFKAPSFMGTLLPAILMIARAPDTT